jgi:hypothetical protein
VTPSKAARKAESKQQQQQSAQSVAYQRMLKEFGLDAEAATFARQLVAKQAPRQQQQQAAAQPPPATKLQQVAAPAVKQAGLANVVIVPVKRPASAPASSGAGASGVAGSSTAGSDAALMKPPGARELMRIIGYYGDWICFCSEVNKLWDTCQCGQQPPCR